MSIDMEQATEKALTRKVLQDLNHQYHNQFNRSFVDSVLVNCKEVPISKKTLKSEKKQILRRCRDHINQQFRENAALTLLSEDESLRSYQRKRLAQSFECATPPKKKSHSPNWENVAWDTQSVLRDLQEWPEGRVINWSEFARLHQVPGKNAGQVVKEFAQKNGIDAIKLDHRTPNRRSRSHKKLFAYGISSPSNPTPETIKADIAEMVKHWSSASG